MDMDVIFAHPMLSSWSPNSSSLYPNWSTKLFVICWVWKSANDWQSKGNEA